MNAVSIPSYNLISVLSQISFMMDGMYVIGQQKLNRNIVVAQCYRQYLLCVPVLP